MAHKSDLIAGDIEAYLKAHQYKGLLRFMTCGSVDDGKSTLIGRLLYESKMIFEDQLAALEADSKKVGTQGDDLDLALLVDGLAAEREQGITIDVAYRFFSTDKRKFIVADTPGHEQYTRNMVTAASTVDLAVILIDARKGVLTQTRRHSYLVSLLGIRKIVLAINKMDTVGFSQETFHSILEDFRTFAKLIGLQDIVAIPISALKGDNVTQSSPHTPWYSGPALMEYLESVEIEQALQSLPFRMPVQWVNRPDQDFRGFAGMITSGVVKKGDRIRVLPSGKEGGVMRIVTHDGDYDQGIVGQSVTLTLEHEIDISRGDVLVSADSPAGVADQFQVTLIWMHEDSMLPGRPYLLKIGACIVGAAITSLKHKVNVNTLEHLAAKKLELNEIGICNIGLDRQIPFDPYTENRETGSFILIDRIGNETVGAGLIHFALRRADNIHWQALDVNKVARAELKGQKPCVLWFTGLSGAGKSTIANLLEKRLLCGRKAHLSAGWRQRSAWTQQGLRFYPCRPGGEHTPYRGSGAADGGCRSHRARVVHLAVSLRAAHGPRARGRRRIHRSIRRHTARRGREAGHQGLYKKARRGELQHFTGIDSPYEAPEHAEIRIDTLTTTADEAVELIIAKLASVGILSEG